MKKEYKSPKAEKMEFNYSDTVVAESGGCRYFITKSDWNYVGCDTTDVKNWTGDKVGG